MENKIYHEINGRKYGLGCLRDPPHKDARLLLTREQIETLPASYMINDITPVEDQESEGSCTGNAGDNEYKIRDAIATGTFVNGARQQIYQCSLAHDGNPLQDVGSSLSTTAWVLQNIGVAPESEFPYTGGMQGPVPTNVLADAKKHEATVATRLDAADASTTITNVKAAIAPNAVIQSSYPVMFGFNVPNSFFNTGSDGNMPAPSGGIAGGHANVFIGYDDNHTGNYDGSKGAFYVKNSWGEGWGKNGYWYMPYSFFLDTDEGVGDCWAVINTSDFNPAPPTPTAVTFASSSAVSAMTDTRTDVFVQGSDKALWHSYFVEGAKMAAWESLGGVIASQPSAVWLGSELHAFVKGTDAAVWHIKWDGTKWTAWESLQGVLLTGTAPAAVVRGDLIDVYVIGHESGMWRSTLTAGVWGGWTEVASKIK